jgi:hypothetical protein
MLAAALHRQAGLPDTHRNGCGGRAEQALDCVDQGIQNLAYAIRELFRLFGHLSFIMGSPVTVSTATAGLSNNSQPQECACMFT